MFLRAKRRFKDGKEHRYWSIVENHRAGGGRVVQRQVLYLGEINDSQQAAWCRSIEILEGDASPGRQMALFSDDRPAPDLDGEVVQVRLSDLSLPHPRQWGGCWLALPRWDPLSRDGFWGGKLKPSRQGTRWLNVLKILVCHRLLAPGSEWALHRQWYGRTALADLLGEEQGVAKDVLYRCLDRLLAYQQDFFTFLTGRWQTLFGAKFDVLLYDLTSTYFECVPPEEGKRRFGYSRDKRSDCVQVVIALMVTPEGFPMAYEVMPGNTSDKTTLKDFLAALEQQYGKAQRTWVMDRGIPTEETLQEMREADPPVHYLVGTPKGRLTQLEKTFLKRPWEEVRESIQVKLLEQEQEMYVLTRSEGRVDKERAMRRRRLKRLWRRLKELQKQTLTRDELLLKLGAAKKDAGRAYGLVDIQLPAADQPVTAESFCFSLRKKKLRQTRRREGCYLLRSNLTASHPAQLWQHYIQLTEIEQAFKELKGDLGLRPIYHQHDGRIEAHIFVAFIAYCLQITLKFRARRLAPGLTPRAILEKFSAIQMVDVHLPTTDGRHLVLPRFTQPDPDQQLLLKQLELTLPNQPPPRIRTPLPSPTKPHP
jgi:transposase